MSELNTDQPMANPSTQPSPAASDPASMVTPKNQVVLEPQNLPVAADAQASAPSAESASQAPMGQPAAPEMAAEVAWPDAQQAAAGIAESAPSQPTATTTKSKVGLIVGLLIVLGLLIGVYLVLRAL